MGVWAAVRHSHNINLICFIFDQCECDYEQAKDEESETHGGGGFEWWKISAPKNTRVWKSSYEHVCTLIRFGWDPDKTFCRRRHTRVADFHNKFLSSKILWKIYTNWNQLSASFSFSFSLVQFNDDDGRTMCG